MKITKPHRFTSGTWIARLAALLCGLALFCNATTVQAITQNDLNSIKQGTPFFDSTATDCEQPSQNPIVTVGAVTYYGATPPGATPEDQIYNFFVGTVHITPAGAAGIMGNIQAESHFNPKAEENPGAWEDMSSLDVNHGGKGGVGLVQWDGGRRPAYIKYARSHGADPQSIIPQLNYIWNELNTSHKDALTGGNANGRTYAGIQNATNAGEAALTFHALYEISGDDAEHVKGRSENANTLLEEHVKSDTAASGTASSGCATTTGSPNCGGVATGRAQIVCDAEKYDIVSYSESLKGGHQGAVQWHKECNAIYAPPNGEPGGIKVSETNWAGTKCYLDCSGLVNIAVYDVYGADLDENTDSERDHIGTNWKEIQFDKVLPGDIVQPNPGHVEIIKSTDGDWLNTFGAHTDNPPQKDQVSKSRYRTDSDFRFFRYIGSGAPAA